MSTNIFSIFMFRNCYSSKNNIFVRKFRINLKYILIFFIQKLRLGRGSEKFKKRLMELESQLVLVSPNLVFRIKHRQTAKTYTFFLSSEFERTQWIEAIQTLQRTSKPPVAASNFSMFELQTWITACRTFLKTNMGSYLLRTGHDEKLLVGDLHITIFDMQGLEFTAGM